MTARYIQTTLLLAVLALTAAAQTSTRRAADAHGPDTHAAEYKRALDDQVPLIADEDLAVRQAARIAIDELCGRAGAPGAADRRLALCQEIAERLTTEINKPARVWLLRKLAEIGRGEVVAALETLLSDEDAQIRELARRALQANPDPEAGVALRDALASTEDAAWRVGLINAIGSRRQPRDVKLLVPLCTDADPAVVKAAIAALADIADADAAAELAMLLESSEPELRPVIADACVRAASGAARHSPTRAARVLNAVYTSGLDERVRASALRGLVSVRGMEMYGTLGELVRGPSAYLSVAAAQLADALVGDKSAARLTDLLRGATPAAQAVLLDKLADRREPSAHDPAVRLLGSPEQGVRLAAAEALATLGSEKTVPALVAYATDGTSEDRAGATASLKGLSGDGVNGAIAAELREADSAIRTDLIAVLRARGATDQLPAFFAVVDYADKSGQRAALDAVGELGGDDEIAALLDIAIAKRTGTVCDAAQNAIVRIRQRGADAEQHARPVLERMGDADTDAKPVLLRILGRLKGAEALAAVRDAAGSDDEAVRDAAVRALCDWREPAALDDLFAITTGGESRTHRVLAFRGIVHILRQPAVGTPEERLAHLRRAAGLADQADMKKQVLGTLATIPCVAALEMAQEHMADAGLAAEARAAVLDIAVGVAGQDAEIAEAALQRLSDVGATDEEAKRIGEALEVVRMCRVYCTVWLVSPPYTLEGRTGLDLVDDVLAPETAGATEIQWQPLRTTNAKTPWEFDLNAVAQATECAIFVRTRFKSPEARQARLHVGSDDGVKVWLNDAEVHRAQVTRGLACGSDVVDVELREGWNTLMLKVTQGGGGWGFCCGITDADDEPVPGLRYAAE